MMFLEYSAFNVCIVLEDLYYLKIIHSKGSYQMKGVEIITMRISKIKSSILVRLVSVGLILALTIAGLYSLVGLAAQLGSPALSIPSNLTAPPGSTVAVPITFSSNGNQIASLVFSIDYDQNVLLYDDSLPNAISFSLPADFVGSCSADITDTDGEIDCFILDPTTPLAALPDSVVLTVTLRTLSPSSDTFATVGFSTDSPPASFGDVEGQSVAGTTSDGAVWVGTGPPPLLFPKAFLPFVGRELLPVVTLIPSNTPTATPTLVLTTTPTATPTNTATPPSCSNLIINGGFENNKAWELPATAYTAGYSSDRSHNGNRSLRTGIVNSLDNVFSYSSGRQLVHIPSASSSAQLKFWRYSISGETSSKLALGIPTGRSFETSIVSSNDLQYVIIVDAYNNWIGTLLWQLSNNRTWTSEQFDLIDYAGMNIKVQFGTFNNGTDGVTSMYVDDVSLQVCP